MKIICIACLLALFAMSGYTQSSRIISGQVINEAIKLHDKQEYKKAIELYKQIARNDTNYAWALYEMSLSFMHDSSYAEAIQICNEGLQLDDKSQELLLFISKANSLDYMGKSAEALMIFDSALVRYPNAENLLLNKAITLMRAEKIDDAEKILKDLIVRNPYYGSAHAKLATCAWSKGRIVPTMMSLFTYLLISPHGAQNKNAISLLNNISKSTDAANEVLEKRKAPEDVFTQAEQVILSKIALDKNYKLKANLDDPIVRQLQALMEVLQYDPSSNDFWMQYYVPLMKDMFKESLLEPAANLAFSAVEIEAIQRYLKKNSKETKEASAYIVNYLNQVRTTRELNFSQRNKAAVLYHFSDNTLFGKGEMDSKGNLVGPWELYFRNGNIKATGEFSKEGKKTGNWTFYFENGGLNGREQWKDGIQTGVDETYNQDGVLVAYANFSEGKLNGEKKSYYAIGGLKTIATYKDDELNGPYKSFYSTGSKSAEAYYLNNKLHGPYKTFLKTGQAVLVAEYKEDELEGPYKSYHKNGQLSFEGVYQKGKPTGSTKSYHPNGKLEEVRTFEQGKLHGIHFSYNDEGVVVSEIPYKDGRAEGVAKYYDDDGKLFSTLFFEKDILKEARYFNKQGNEISTSARKNKNIDLSVYNAEGFRSLTATYNDAGEKINQSTYYYNSGKVKGTEDYKKGMLDGLSVGYYESGAKSYEIAYSKDLKHGAAIYFHPNNKVKSQGYYQEDTRIGEWEEYNEKGNIEERYNFSGGDFNGYYEYYAPNGKLMYEEIYKQGWLTGLNSFDTTGKKIHSVTFKNGTGKYVSLFPNGIKRLDGDYIQGEFHGSFVNYYFDGSQRISKTYNRGELDGTYTEFHYGGQIAVKGEYKLGERTGLWKYFLDNGKIWKEEPYSNGEINGKVIIYHENGKAEREIEYKNSQRHGMFKRFAEDGQLMLLMYYKNGSPTAYNYNDKNGKLLEKIPIPGSNGKVTGFYANGNKSIEMEFADGQINGHYKFYHPDGKIMYHDIQEYGYSQGKLMQYYSNGQLKSEYNYYYENEDGPYKEYYENGKVKEEGQFFNGNRHGLVKHYDANGSLTSKRTYYYGTLINVIK